MELGQHVLMVVGGLAVLLASNANLGSFAFVTTPSHTKGCQQGIVSGLGSRRHVGESANWMDEKPALNNQDDESPSSRSSRRSFFRKVGWMGMISSPLPWLATAGSSNPAFAATDVEEPAGVVSVDELANKLRSVPTFAIVDPKGVPYTVVGEDAKITGYFFTTYDEAERILKLARKSADQGLKEASEELISKRKAENLPPLSKQEVESEVGSNPWNDARISTIPLDVATTLSLSRPQTKGGNFFQIAAAASDIEDAMEVTGKSDVPERLVPLFYMADFTISSDGGIRQPLYFRKQELLDDYRRFHPKEKTLPPVLVTDLFASMTVMVKPGGKEEMKIVSFESPKESAKKAKECVKRGGSEAPLFLGQRIVVL